MKRLNKGESSFALASVLQDAVQEAAFSATRLTVLAGRIERGSCVSMERWSMWCKAIPKPTGEGSDKKTAISSLTSERPAMEIARECGRAAIHKAEVLSLKSTALFLPDYTDRQRRCVDDGMPCV